MSEDCGGAADEELSSNSPLPEEQPNSPLHTMPADFRDVLDEFRDNWQRELQGQVENNQTPGTAANMQFSNAANVEAEKHAMAQHLFRKAAELEHLGKVYDALPLYRKAIQIVPDIEFKFYEQQKVNKAAEGVNQPAISNTPDLGNLDCEELVGDLYEKFRSDLACDYGGKLILNSRDANVISTELHISDLPPEILLYILRWVVSTQLDMRSLEQCAAVCKGLYLCARDEDLWRLTCMKVWGYNLGTLLPPNTPAVNASALGCMPYYTWRQMYMERERVHFSGCYISKTTYLRMGENSFQDQFYRPVQLVEYYRYVRFLPDGTVLMMTNADEPLQGVAKLRNLYQLRPDVLRGHYRLFGNTVSIILKKSQQPQPRIISTGAGRRRGSNAFGAEDASSTNYCIEFRIMSTAKRRFVQLTWLHYSIEQTRNKVTVTTEFDLTPQRYPPLWFSPVRSYHLDADAPLA